MRLLAIALLRPALCVAAPGDLDPTHGRPSAADGGAEGRTSL